MASPNIVGPMGQSLDYIGQTVWDEYEDADDNLGEGGVDGDAACISGSNDGVDQVADIRVVEHPACIEEIQVI